MRTVGIVLVALMALGCSSESPTSEAQPEPGETGGGATVTEATGGQSPMLTTGGSSQMIPETGGASAAATGGRAATGGAAATGGHSATGVVFSTGGSSCKPGTCSDLTKQVSASDLGGFDNSTGSGTWNGSVGCGISLKCTCKFDATVLYFVCS
jgi:hypothetical protein